MADPTKRLSVKKPIRRRASAKKTVIVGDYKRLPKTSSETIYAYAGRLLTEARTHLGENHQRVARELIAEAQKAAASLSASKASRIYGRIEAIEKSLAETSHPTSEVKASSKSQSATRAPRAANTTGASSTSPTSTKSAQSADPTDVLTGTASRLRRSGPSASAQSANSRDVWTPFKVGDRVVYQGIVGTVSRAPDGDYEPSELVTFLKDGNRIGRRVVASALQLATSENTSDASDNVSFTPKNTDESTVDPTKDKALIDAFSAAITAALSEEAA